MWRILNMKLSVNDLNNVDENHIQLGRSGGDHSGKIKMLHQYAVLNRRNGYHMRNIALKCLMS